MIQTLHAHIITLAAATTLLLTINKILTHLTKETTGDKMQKYNVNFTWQGQPKHITIPANSPEEAQELALWAVEQGIIQVDPPTPLDNHQPHMQQSPQEEK